MPATGLGQWDVRAALDLAGSTSQDRQLAGVQRVMPMMKRESAKIAAGLLVAAVALIVGIAAAGNRLMSKENGYGMEPAQLFELPEQAPVSSGEPGE